MTDYTSAQLVSPTLDEPSGAQGSVQDQAQALAGQAGEQPRQLKLKVGDQVRQQLDTRTNQVADELQPITDGLHAMSERLREEGSSMPAQLAEQGAEKTEQLSAYLRQANSEQILNDVEEFARRRPWVIAGAGVLAGLAASRLLKASSSRRYQSSRVAQPDGQVSVTSAYDSAGPTIEDY